MVNLRRKKLWAFGDKRHIDEKKIEQRNASRLELRELIESGDIERYIRYVKRIRQDVTPEQMEDFVKLFYEQRSRHPNDDDGYPS